MSLCDPACGPGRWHPHAPFVIAAAKHGTDGTTLDPLVIGSLAALRIGSESTLDNVPSTTLVVAAHDSDTARGKLIDVTGRISSIQREGSYSVGTLTTDAEPVHFVTPFAVREAVDTSVHFRGVFVQRYAPASPSQSEPPSPILVGASAPFRPRARHRHVRAEQRPGLQRHHLRRRR